MDNFAWRLRTNQYGGLANFSSLDWRYAQLFDPAKSGEVSSVILYVATRYHQPVELDTVLSLHEVDNDIPLDPALYSAVLNLSSAELVGYAVDYDYYRLETGVSWRLEHQRHALVLTPQIIPGELQAYVMELPRTGWHGEVISEGEGGAVKMILSTDGGDTWITESVHDLSFGIAGTFDVNGGNGNGPPPPPPSLCCWPWIFVGIAGGVIAKAAYPKIKNSKGAKYGK